MDVPDFPGAPRIARYSFLEPCLLLRVAGQGGMGLVYEAYDTLRSRKVAVKVSSNPVSSPRFYLEAVLGIADLGEHVVQVLDIRRFQATDYILMEWVEGADLQTICAEGVLNSNQLVGVARQLCDGLGRIHDKGIIHRDIKPANLMVTYEGVVKLADLGIAQSSEAMHMATVGPIGTRIFMSPEQRDGLKADERSDIYSAGVTLYMLATGLMQRERSGDLQRMLQVGLQPVQDLAPDLHPGLAQIITRASEQSPDDRFQTVAEVDAALAALEISVEEVLPERTRLATTLPSKDIIRQAREYRNQSGVQPSGQADPTVALAGTVLDETGGRPPASPWGKRVAGVLCIVGLIGLGALAIQSNEPPPKTAAQPAVMNNESAAPLELERPKPQAETVANGPAEEQKPVEHLDETQVVKEPSSPRAQSATEPVPLLPALAGFSVHVDDAERPAYVPDLTIALSEKVERKLRFVDLNLKGEPGLLVQEMEVAREVAFHVGVLEEDPGADRCLAWTNIDLDQATALVARLNELRPEGAAYRFLIPTQEQRMKLEALTPFCTLSLGSTKTAPEKTPTGEAPKLRSPGKTLPAKSVYDSDAWYAAGKTGLYGVVGSVAELCLTGHPTQVEYRGGADADRAKGDIFVHSNRPAVNGYRSDSYGLRLFLQIDPK